MYKENIVFTDVDGTLCFHEDKHGVQKIRDTEPPEEGNAVVRLTPSEREVYAIDISTSLYRVYLDVVTQRRAQILSTLASIILVTGARPSTMQARLQTFDFQAGSILENGAAVFNRKFERDRNWDAYLAQQKILLAPLIRDLQGRGLKLDIEGRTTMIRIRHQDNSHLTEDEFFGLFATLELPEGLKKTKNLGNIDIILEKAGKGEAIKYLLNQQSQKPRTFGIGDDINDQELLETVQEGFVLKSAYPEVLELARKSGMYISEGHHFDGINEILSEISKRIQK